ncbi:sarcosine oxidase subunit gamma [Celeribacter indicus]|uniref:Sarcosine oxidase, gamma subunit n=1 Tax=Celeribacter indicus TaxID=1208324 RepID=A0A0B5E7W9_9RHOB|nr:sarcosine oxidase subunit gamma family protein [Celeribacter indicus]AJE49136.1 sarcosine oxidase, gamma subunit [Celeribacter indicus]SDX17319.1 sarcosine oxidase subunit gamma [Celeribacter indicus]
MSKHISSLAPSVAADASIVAETSAARVAVSPLTGRISLRARGDLAAFDAALGIALPTRIGARVGATGIEAVCLGPDEWTLLVPLDRIGQVEDALAALYPARPHAVTEITGREVTFAIEGPRAADLLTIGCPRDIAAIPVGEARRTLFDGATVVLWRDAADRFRMDVWNSFVPFLASTLETGCKELAAEAV